MDYEARRLLSAIVKNVVQMTAEELEPTNDDNRYNLSILSQVLLYFRIFLVEGFQWKECVSLKQPISAFILQEAIKVDPNACDS